MIFFTHQNFPSQAGELLREFDRVFLGTNNDFDISPYPPATPDTEWIPLAGKRNPKPFILSFDDGMLRNKVARSVLRDSGCHFIYFGGAWSKTKWFELAWRLVKYWPQIIDVADSVTKQTVIEVTINGKIYSSSL